MRPGTEPPWTPGRREPEDSDVALFMGWPQETRGLRFADAPSQPSAPACCQSSLLRLATTRADGPHVSESGNCGVFAAPVMGACDATRRSRQDSHVVSSRLKKER